MKGILERIEEKESKNGGSYWLLTIGNEKYSAFERKDIEGVAEGDTVNVNYKKAGKYKNITELKKVGNGHDEELYRMDKENRIVRMSSLKSASEIVSGLKLGLPEKVEATLATAKDFERYITGEQAKSE